MELRDYLAIVRKRWLSIVLITVLATAAAVAATLTATPTYTARSQVYVSVRTGGSTADLLQGSNFAARQVKSYTDIVTTPRVLLPVIDHLDRRPPSRPPRTAGSTAPSACSSAWPSASASPSCARSSTRACAPPTTSAPSPTRR